LDATITVPLHASGQPTPNPLPARGLIDTGSDLTVVSLPLLQQLGVMSHQSVTTHGLGGQVQANRYPISLHILDFRNRSGPWLTHPILSVMGLPLGIKFDVLIGMDVLLGCKLVVDGPSRRFTLEF